MKYFGKVLLVFGLSFFCIMDVFADLNYLSVDTLEDAVNQSYTGLVQYADSYYYFVDGEMIKDDIVTIDSEDYYFDDTGIMQDTEEDESNDNEINLLGKENDDDDTLAEDKDISGEWVTSDEKTYYLYPDGTKAIGWVTIDGVKCFFNEDGELIEKNALKIVDVSHHRGEIDWDTVKETDVDGAIIRLGYGTSYTTDDPVIDRQWDNNYAGTTNNDLLFGVYLYSYAIDEVSANLEADFVINNLNQKNYDKSHYVYYDLEDNPWTENLSMDEYDIIIDTFVDRLGAEGYQPQIYTYKWYAENRFSDNARSKLSWIAQYYSVCTYSGSYTGWQYTDSGDVDGINGPVDISVFKNNEPIDDEIIEDDEEEIIVEDEENQIVDNSDDSIVENLSYTIDSPILINPKTGDNIMLYFQLLVISILGVVSSIILKNYHYNN